MKYEKPTIVMNLDSLGSMTPGLPGFYLIKLFCKDPVVYDLK